MPTKLSPEVIAAAIEGFESQKKRIDAQIVELRVMLNGKHPASAAPEPAKRKRRKISAAGRKRIAAAQRQRWVATKTAPSLQEVIPEAPKRKRRLSSAGRKRIIEATKRRWTLKRTEAEKAKGPVIRKRAGNSTAANRAAA